MLGKYIGDCDYSVIGISGDDDTGGGDSLTTKNLKTNRTIIVTTFFIFLYYIYIQGDLKKWFKKEEIINSADRLFNIPPSHNQRLSFCVVWR